MKIQIRFVLLCCCVSRFPSGDANNNISRLLNVGYVVSKDAVATWKAPEELRKKFIYYWSGFDEECRPVWVVETGKWNLRKSVDGGEESKNLLRTYMVQMAYNAIKSLNKNHTGCEQANQIVAVMDMDSFNWHQLSSSPTMHYALNLVKDFLPLILKYIHSLYIVNTNYVAEIFVNLVRPIFGSFMERVEIYGTNKASWLPILLKKIPRTQLPEWYGGDKDFAPVKIYG